MQRLRVLLADDHRIILEGLSSLLEAEAIDVKTAGNGRESLELTLSWKPDIAVLDIAMPGLNGIDVARQVRKLSPRTRVIFLTMHSDVSYVREAFQAGAAGYLVKMSAVAELRSAIREVSAGRNYISPQVAGGLINAITKVGTEPEGEENLTLRQREVLQLVAEGKTNKEIAATLHISVKTVEYHKSAITAKTDLHTTADLTRYAIRRGLIDDGTPSPDPTAGR